MVKVGISSHLHLRKLDSALADEMEEYRKNYAGGIQGVPVNLNK